MAKLKAAEKLLKMGVEAVEKGVKQFSLPKAEKPLRKSADTIKKEELVDVPVNKPVAAPAPVTKPKSQAQIDREAKEARSAQAKETITKRGLTAGENIFPIINPDEKELGLIRRMHGESPFRTGKTDKQIEAELEETFIDPNVGLPQLKPPVTRATPDPATQYDLPRKPPRASGIRPEVTELLANPQLRAQVIEKIKRGQGMGAQNWYNAEPLRQAFIAELGPEDGEAGFNMFIKMIGPTAAQQKVGPNIRSASNYFNQAKAGRTDPYVLKRWGEDAWEAPQNPYGHYVQQNMMEGASKIQGGGDIDPMENPKIARFVQNLLGNWKPATVDIHAMRLLPMLAKDPRFLSRSSPGKGAPSPADLYAQGKLSLDDATKNATLWQDSPMTEEYSAWEDYWKGLADELGMSPAEVQASAWMGGGDVTGNESTGAQTFMDFFADRIRRTSIRDNIPPEQVLKLVVQGRMTLAELMQQEQMPGAPQVG